MYAALSFLHARCISCYRGTNRCIISVRRLWRNDTALLILLNGAQTAGVCCTVLLVERVEARRRWAARLIGAAFVSPILDFYLTNPIARASRVMAECSQLAQAPVLQAAE